jgi:3-hydroxyacyl-[acyl-carrier-protein] dehydratase
MRFIFVDRILAMSPGQSIEAEHLFSGEEDFFQDHFPGFPVVPGVLLTEMMGQTAALCLNAESRETGRGKAMLTQIRSASFREWVRPGVRATIKAHIKTNRSELATAACSVEIACRRICSAELLFTFLSLDQLAPGYHDDVLESYLAGAGRGRG